MRRAMTVMMATVVVSASGVYAEEAGHGHEGGGAAMTDASLIQVMHDLAAEMNRLQFGLFTGNRYQIERAARSIASHPTPKGGVKPYVKKNGDQIKAMVPEIDASIHGAAAAIADTARTAPIATLAARYSEIATGCVNCHLMFRDTD